MFEMGKWASNGNYYLRDGNHNYLHSDGQVYRHAAEYWPTRELAQAVLDKYQSKHVWKHGDVFKRSNRVVMMYVVVNDGPIVYRVYSPSSKYRYPGYHPSCAGDLSVCLADATFLFNIREKL